MKSILNNMAAIIHTDQKMKSGIFKSLFFSLVTSLCILAQVNFAVAQTAGILSQAVTQFFDNNGNPLSLGTVNTYIAGTSTNKTTWQDPLETTPNTNPISLDIAGRAIIYGQGTYTETVKDSHGNLIWTGLTQPIGVTANQTLIGDGQPVGATFPWSGFIAPNQYAFAYGQTISRTTYAALFAAITISTTAACFSGNNTISGIVDTTQISVGSAIETICVNSPTTVVSKTSSTVTMSNPAITTLNATVVFFPWGNGDGSTTFAVPDLRGVALAGRPNMGGVDNGKLTAAFYGPNPDGQGVYGGTQSTVLTQSNLPNTNLTSSALGLTLSVANGASNVCNSGSCTSGNNSIVTAAQTPSSINILTNGNITLTPYAFTFGGTVTTPLGGSATPIPTVQPTVTINYIIKITPDINASTTNGVASIGGMTGVILCGADVTCSGNTISVAVTSAVTSVANSDGSANVTPTSGNVIVNAGYGVDANILNLQNTGSPYTIQTSDCSKTILNSNNIVATWTLPSVSGFPTNCSITLKNRLSNTTAVTLSGFPVELGNFLYPGQSFDVKIVDGTWRSFYAPGPYAPINAINLFVSASGNDANDGLTVSTPITLATACGSRRFQFFNPTAMTINMADGTYNVPDGNGAICSIEGNSGGTSNTLVNLIGDCSTPTNVILSIPAGDTGIFTKDLGEVEVSCLELTGTTGANVEIGISGAQFSVADLQKIVFGAFGTGSVGIQVSQNASVNLIGTAAMTINSVAANSTIISVSSGGVLTAGGGATIAIPSAVAWGAQFIQGFETYNLSLSSLTFTGSGVGGTTGKRATLIGPGYMATGAVACNSFFPGNGSCTLVNGAQDDASDNGTTPYPSGGITCGPGAPTTGFTVVKGIVTAC